MHVRDIMTRDVMTVTPETPLPALAALFAERGISGVPVVEADGKLVGMATEGDLMRRLAAEGEPPRSWFRSLLESEQRQAQHYAQTHGRHARDVMSTELLTISEEESVNKAAAILEQKGIRRLPVVRDGKLIGILSRADLMRAVLAPPEAAATATSDREIHTQIRREMRKHPWADSYLLFVDVVGGVATFHGFCRSTEIGQALRVLAEAVPGVKDVRLDLAPTPVFVID